MRSRLYGTAPFGYCLTVPDSNRSRTLSSSRKGDKLRQLRFEEGIDTGSIFVNIIVVDCIIYTKKKLGVRDGKQRSEEDTDR